MSRLVLALTLLLTAGSASANPRPLAFTYGADLQPPGALELEQYVDVVPVRVAREDPVTGLAEGVTSHRYSIETELEYGVTDWLEASFYMVWRQGASATTPALRFQGVKQRVRIRPFSPGSLPVDLALYLEVAEFHDELELEQKLIIARSFDRLKVAVDLWIEEEIYFQIDETKLVFAPTAGATYELDPHLLVGLEYWMRAPLGRSGDAVADVPASTHHYAGPNVMLQGGPVWLTTAVYLRLDDLDRNLGLDDPFGRVWVRFVLGVGLHD